MITNRIAASLTAAIFAMGMIHVSATSISEGNLKLDYDNGKLTLYHNGFAAFNDIYSTATYNFEGEETKSISSKDYAPMVTVTTALKEFGDQNEFGEGQVLKFVHTGDGMQFVRTYAMYPGLSYVIAQASVVSTNGKTIYSNCLVPMTVGENTDLPEANNNRILWVPFENDGHQAYGCQTISTSREYTSVSHEVGCTFNIDSRFGLVAGSVDHDNWKNGVTVTGNYGRRILKFECLSGLSSELTHDQIPHGKLHGQKVSSARFMFGAFDDWREGLYAFADANATVVPPMEWKDGNPIGWSSYGSHQAKVNLEGVHGCARFLKDELFDKGFHNANGQTAISLDAFGEDNISASNLKRLATQYFAPENKSYNYGGQKYTGTNQILGLYGGPFVIWDWTLDSQVYGAPEYTNRDMALKVNGQIQPVWYNNSGCHYIASDPTHPAMEKLIKAVFKKYNDLGAKYVKIDFMNSGIVQGDSYYNPEITTGVQAYNYGMKMIREEAEKYGMYVVLAMSPAFPYQYTQGRRTCCDRFSEIGESEFVMNSISYGFWMDRLYKVLDPDQLVFYKNDSGLKETEGENRARATTGVVTGAYIFGDNYCETAPKDDNGNIVGHPVESKERARLIMGNERVNEYVRTHTGAFTPVPGNEYNSPYRSETVFVRHDDNATYVAVFNFSSSATKRGELKFTTLGIPVGKYNKIQELWSGDFVSMNSGNNGFSYEIGPKDAHIYKLYNTSSGIEDLAVDGGTEDARLNVALDGEGRCQVAAAKKMTEVAVYGSDGRLLGQASHPDGAAGISVSLAGSPRIAIVKAVMADGTIAVVKAARR